MEIIAVRSDGGQSQLPKPWLGLNILTVDFLVLVYGLEGMLAQAIPGFQTLAEERGFKQ